MIRGQGIGSNELTLGAVQIYFHDFPRRRRNVSEMIDDQGGRESWDVKGPLFLKQGVLDKEIPILDITSYKFPAIFKHTEYFRTQVIT